VVGLFFIEAPPNLSKERRKKKENIKRKNTK
jgi:hypothetical protein